MITKLKQLLKQYKSSSVAKKALKVLNRRNRRIANLNTKLRIGSYPGFK